MTLTADSSLNYVLQNGAVINLVGKSATWNVTGLQLGFAADAKIGIVLPAHHVIKSGDYVIAWEEGKAPANVDTVTFLAKGESGARLQLTSTGLIVRSGLAILLR